MPDLDDQEAFAQAMGDVKPLKREARVTLNNRATSADTIDARRRAAASEDLMAQNMLSGEYVERVTPQGTLSFQRSGIQNGVFRNLRLGKLELEARLDLHNHTVDQARRVLNEFIGEALTYGIRCVLLSHGKGEGRDEPALLKSCIAHWLPQVDAVLAFHSAQQRHGGAGATYILLRRGDVKR